MAVLLPHHVVEEILSRLPAKTLLRFRCVCRAWLDIISDLNFIKLHLKQSVEQDTIKFNVWNSGMLYDLDVKSSTHAELSNAVQAREREFWYYIGSCDGLIFFFSNSWKRLLGMNPSTKARKVVAEFEESMVADSLSICRDPISFDFKLLRFDYVTSYSSEVTAYSLSKKTWENVRNVPYHLYHGGEFLFRGAMHWIADSKVHRVILVFRMDVNSFSEMTLFNEDTCLSCNGQLTQWENKLCVVDTPKVNDRITIDVIAVWVMREYGNKESWTKLFVIDNLNNIQVYYVCPLHMRVLGKMALEINYRGEDKILRKDMFVYDEKNRLLVEIKVVRRKNNKNKRVRCRRWFVTHVDSLLDPQQLLEAGQGKLEEKKKNKKST